MLLRGPTHPSVSRSGSWLNPAARSCFLAVIGAGIALTWWGCAHDLEPACRAGENVLVTETLYFGTRAPDGVISQDTWSGFIDQTVTPNFPEGLTSWSASGQWRMADGAIVREPSYVLQLTHAASEERDQAVTRIMDQYKNRYRQEAVMRVRSTACVSF